MINDPEMVKSLLDAPEGQISDLMKTWIRAWSVPPTKEEMIKTRGDAVYSSECSDFVIMLLSVMIGDL